MGRSRGRCAVAGPVLGQVAVAGARWLVAGARAEAVDGARRPGVALPCRRGTEVPRGRRSAASAVHDGLSARAVVFAPRRRAPGVVTGEEPAERVGGLPGDRRVRRHPRRGRGTIGPVSGFGCHKAEPASSAEHPVWSNQEDETGLNAGVRRILAPPTYSPAPRDDAGPWRRPAPGPRTGTCRAVTDEAAQGASLVRDPPALPGRLNGRGAEAGGGGRRPEPEAGGSGTEAGRQVRGAAVSHLRTCRPARLHAAWAARLPPPGPPPGPPAFRPPGPAVGPP